MRRERDAPGAVAFVNGDRMQVERFAATRADDGISVLLTFSGTDGRESSVQLAADELGGLIQALVRLDEAILEDESLDEGGPEGPGR